MLRSLEHIDNCQVTILINNVFIKISNIYCIALIIPDDNISKNLYLIVFINSFIHELVLIKVMIVLVVMLG